MDLNEANSRLRRKYGWDIPPLKPHVKWNHCQYKMRIDGETKAELIYRYWTTKEIEEAQKSAVKSVHKIIQGLVKTK